jgi:hypothetical protein
MALSVILFAPAKAKEQKEKDNLIQLAILLDASGSMDGLIEQTKSQIWKIVNELALAKKGGKNPEMEVALYIYGRDDISAKEGYLRMIVPLSTDLDKISEELFKITTNGGSEYCGKVIQTATEGLAWSKNNKNLKVIVIAGNEAFTQGDVDYKKACKAAITKGIIVNTIFCGNNQEGINTKWKDGADLADGKYMNIDQNQKIVHIDAPQDKEIVRLGEELNKTYIAYGSGGAAKKERQAAQDVKAKKMAPSVMVQRSVAKSSGQYRNKNWDLVDAEEEGALDVAEMKAEELPEEMKGMNAKERKKYVADMKKKRETLQTKIKKLNEDRRTYVAKERKKMAQDNTLDQAIIGAMKEQAKKRDFKF